MLFSNITRLSCLFTGQKYIRLRRRRVIDAGCRNTYARDVDLYAKPFYYRYAVFSPRFFFMIT